MFDAINKNYKKAFDEFGDSASAVMIPKNNQFLRFNSVINLFPKENHLKIIDYGCGLAHFFIYLKKKWPFEFEYIGVDINEDFINYNKDKYKNCKFYLRDEFFLNKNKYDFIVCIGTFNLIYKENIEENKNFIFEEIKKLWNMTNQVLYLNFMSTIVDYQQANAYHQEVGEIYKFISNEVTRTITIDSTYLPHEFSIIGHRERM